MLSGLRCGMSSSHADRQVLWEADVAHLKQTASELLETNSNYASMFEVLLPRAPPASMSFPQCCSLRCCSWVGSDG